MLGRAARRDLGLDHALRDHLIEEPASARRTTPETPWRSTLLDFFVHFRVRDHGIADLRDDRLVAGTRRRCLAVGLRRRAPEGEQR